MLSRHQEFSFLISRTAQADLLRSIDSIGRRIKRNFVKKLQRYERLADDHKPAKDEKNMILSSVNSYLGIMRHFSTYKFRTKQLIRYFRKKLKNHFSMKAEGLKIERKK